MSNTKKLIEAGAPGTGFADSGLPISAAREPTDNQKDCFQALRGLRQDEEASAGIWGLVGMLLLASLIIVIIDKFTPAELGGLAFLAWLVLLAGIVVALFGAFRGE